MPQCILSFPPGGPCSHYPGGQPSAMYVCQGDCRLRNAQGKGEDIPMLQTSWAVTVSMPALALNKDTETLIRFIMSFGHYSLGDSQLF